MQQFLYLCLLVVFVRDSFASISLGDDKLHALHESLSSSFPKFPSPTSPSFLYIRGGQTNMVEEAVFEHKATIVEDTHTVESQIVLDHQQIIKDYRKFGFNINTKLVMKLALALSVVWCVAVELFEELVAEVPFFKR